MIGPFVPGSAAEEPAVAEVWALFRSADVGLANQEGSIFDSATFTGLAAAENGGGYPLAPAVIAAELRSHGIAMVSKANNHATDYGTAGLLASIEALAAAGITQAGGGRDRAAACAPAYVQRGVGTVALISAATTFPPMAAAMAPVTSRGGRFERPGICTIRTREVVLVPPRRMAALRAAAGPAVLPVPGEPGAWRIGDTLFRPAAQAGHRMEAAPEDVAGVIAAIGAARAQGAVVVFALHAHETAGTIDPLPPAAFEPMLLHRANEAPSPDDPAPAAFLPGLFHQAIDAGADVVVRTGPHGLNGAELYRGKPILWGLGSLVFAFGGRRSYVAPGGQRMNLPDDWFTALVAKVQVAPDRAVRVELHPVALASSAEPLRDGLPHRLYGPGAAEVLERFRRRSAAIGTAVRVHGDVASLDGTVP
ncbi:CapA family protein [Novosphingobium piscinae]|uniref:CapA family protein n=1 Tax=Novosphingobium piscinae TaxID=1507448 RepID=A0A7X1FXL3_9SPHN|nr:CapA family protein [Novosphingobium piscinae]